MFCMYMKCDLLAIMLSLCRHHRRHNRASQTMMSAAWQQLCCSSCRGRLRALQKLPW